MERKVVIERDATFADLFAAIDKIEKEAGLGGLHFDEELWDNFNEEIVEEILSFRDMWTEEAKKIKIVDFFRDLGHTVTDIEALLPIKFRKQRKKRGA